MEIQGKIKVIFGEGCRKGAGPSWAPKEPDLGIPTLYPARGGNTAGDQEEWV